MNPLMIIQLIELLASTVSGVVQSLTQSGILPAEHPASAMLDSVAQTANALKTAAAAAAEPPAAA